MSLILTNEFSTFGANLRPAEIANESLYDVDNFGGLRIIEEAYEDLASITESIAALDIITLDKKARALREGVTVESLDSLYEGAFQAKVKAVFSKIKKFLTELWGKVKTFFSNLSKRVIAIFMSGKDFVKKYKDKLDNGAKVTVKGYKYTVATLKDKPKSDYAGLAPMSRLSALKDKVAGLKDEDEEKAKECKKELEDIKDLKDGALDSFRGAMVGKGSVADSVFTKEVLAKFRDGKFAPAEVTYTVAEAVAILEADLSNTVKDVSSNLDNAFKSALSDLNSAESKIKDDDKQASLLIAISKEKVSFVTACQKVVSKYISAWNSVISDANRTTKSVVVKAATGRAEKDK